MTRGLAGWVAAAALLLAPLQVAEAKGPPPTLLQRLRELIGLNRTVHAGGSRSGSAVAVCVIAPRTSLDAAGDGVAVVPLPRPTLLVAEPLNEVRIDRGGKVVFQKRASSTAPIEGPMGWPIEPITPGEELTLLLRPRGASGGDYARITLKGVSAAEQQANEALVSRLGADPKAWLQAVDGALDRQQVALAWALLFAPQDPQSPELDALRQEVWRRGCGG